MSYSKLFRVTLCGFSCSKYGCQYVVADDPTAAYEKVRRFMDKEDIGFSPERELASVELLAEAYQHTDTPSILHVT